jgi:hypothetical protein
MGIIVKNSIPNPNDKISDNQDLDFPTTEASTHTATKIKHKKILDIIQNIKFRTLNPSIENGSCAIAPPSIAPTKNAMKIIADPTKQLVVFEIT